MRRYIKEKIKGIIQRTSKSYTLAPFTIPLKHFLHKYFPSLWLRLKNVANEKKKLALVSTSDCFDDTFDCGMAVRIDHAMNCNRD